ncbi:MAG: tripartite tricarboxylate transporter TctB family protein [Synergistaceae bacterium]|nr:tripartite tricarboxylate transporter TctB family protein [Synergistaceae bacterium]MBR0094807.1 tripartite tricarboxylate transporter TctB family protein [Synergistaceae bacterium]
MKKRDNYKLDIVPGVVLALFALFYMSQIPGIKVFKGLGSTPLNNHFIPWLWGGALLTLSLWLIVRGILKYRRVKAEGKLSNEGSLLKSLSDEREVILSFIALIIYVAFMESVGFIIMTCVYVFAQILILTPTEKWAKNIIPALITAVITGCLLFYIFRSVLNVLLPVGMFGFGL